MTISYHQGVTPYRAEENCTQIVELKFSHFGGDVPEKTQLFNPVI